MADLTHSVSDGADVIAVEGDLDVYTSPALREATMDPELLARSRLVIDLNATTFLDSFGLAVIIGALRRIRAHDGAMAVACTRERVRKAFRVSGMDRVLSVYDTVDEAVAAVRESAGG